MFSIIKPYTKNTWVTVYVYSSHSVRIMAHRSYVVYSRNRDREFTQTSQIHVYRVYYTHQYVVWWWHKHLLGHWIGKILRCGHHRRIMDAFFCTMFSRLWFGSRAVLASYKHAFLFGSCCVGDHDMAISFSWRLHAVDDRHIYVLHIYVVANTENALWSHFIYAPNAAGIVSNISWSYGGFDEECDRGRKRAYSRLHTTDTYS